LDRWPRRYRAQLDPSKGNLLEQRVRPSRGMARARSAAPVPLVTLRTRNALIRSSHASHSDRDATRVHRPWPITLPCTARTVIVDCSGASEAHRAWAWRLLKNENAIQVRTVRLRHGQARDAADLRESGLKEEVTLRRSRRGTWRPGLSSSTASASCSRRSLPERRCATAI
jgi:hypothetical protein